MVSSFKQTAHCDDHHSNTLLIAMIIIPLVLLPDFLHRTRPESSNCRSTRYKHSITITIIITITAIITIIINTTIVITITTTLARLTLLGQFKSGRTWLQWTTGQTSTSATSASPSDMYPPRENSQVLLLKTQIGFLNMFCSSGCVGGA